MKKDRVWLYLFLLAAVLAAATVGHLIWAVSAYGRASIVTFIAREWWP